MGDWQEGSPVLSGEARRLLPKYVTCPGSCGRGLTPSAESAHCFDVPVKGCKLSRKFPGRHWRSSLGLPYEVARPFSVAVPGGVPEFDNPQRNPRTKSAMLSVFLRSLPGQFILSLRAKVESNRQPATAFLASIAGQKTARNAHSLTGTGTLLLALFLGSDVSE